MGATSSGFLWQWCCWFVWGGACHPTSPGLSVHPSTEKLVHMVSKILSYSPILWAVFASIACYAFAIVFDWKEGGRERGREKERWGRESERERERERMKERERENEREGEREKEIRSDALLRAGLGFSAGFYFSRTVPGVLLSPGLSQPHHTGAKPYRSAFVWVSWTNFLLVIH